MCLDPRHLGLSILVLVAACSAGAPSPSEGEGSGRRDVALGPQLDAPGTADHDDVSAAADAPASAAAPVHPEIVPASDPPREGICPPARAGQPAPQGDLVWTPAPLGRQTVVALPSAPFPYRVAPYRDASVLVYLPEQFSGRGGVNAVVHVHGYHDRAVDSVRRHELREQLARSGRDAILIAPQGPEMAADMSLGRLDGRGGLRRLLEDVVALLSCAGLAPDAELGQVVLTAHSGGYRGVANMLDRGGVEVRAVHLFDALYSHESSFLSFARTRGRVLRSSWVYRSGTEDNNEELSRALLGRRVRVSGTFDAASLRLRRVTIGLVRASHEGTMRAAGAYGQWLEVSGLPPSPEAPPVLASALHDGEAALVRWWSDPGAPRREVVVEGSVDGESFVELARSREGRARVEARPWLRVRAVGEGALVSDRYGATGSDWLVVDGFDRSFGGLWSEGTHGFAALVGQALGQPFSVASNEAVVAGLVSLGGYDGVVWMLGDEGREDRVLEPYERRALRRFLAGGGKLIISGSGLAEGLDPNTLASLGARVISPDAVGMKVNGWRLGAAYPPLGLDALDGGEVLWTYDGGGGAAVAMGRQIITVGFGLENLSASRLPEALSQLLAHLDGEPVPDL